MKQEIKAIHEELQKKYPNGYFSIHDVLAELERHIAENWERLSMYSGTECLNIIAENYARPACKGREEDAKQMQKRLMDAALIQ